MRQSAISMAERGKNCSLAWEGKKKKGKSLNYCLAPVLNVVWMHRGEAGIFSFNERLNRSAQMLHLCLTEAVIQLLQPFIRPASFAERKREPCRHCQRGCICASPWSSHVGPYNTNILHDFKDEAHVHVFFIETLECFYQWDYLLPSKESNRFKKKKSFSFIMIE